MIRLNIKEASRGVLRDKGIKWMMESQSADDENRHC